MPTWFSFLPVSRLSSSQQRHPLMYSILLTLVPLTCIVSPSLTVQGDGFHFEGPRPIIAVERSSVLLRCRLQFPSSWKQTTSPLVQWVKDGFGYDNDAINYQFKGRYKMSGPIEQGNFDLEINNLLLEDDGKYACSVNLLPQLLGTNQNQLENLNKISDPVDLTVIVPPSNITLSSFQLAQNHDKIPNSPKRVWVGQNTALEVNCTIPSAKPAALIQWYFQDRLLQTYGDSKTFSDDVSSRGALRSPNHGTIQTFIREVKDKVLNETQSTLRLMMNEGFQKANLTCIVSNAENFLNMSLPSANIEIFIHYVRQVQIHISSKHWQSGMREEEVVTFTCSCDCFPLHDLRYSWYFARDSLQSDQFLATESNLSTYHLRLHRDMDGKTLRCVVTSRVDPLCFTSHLLGSEDVENRDNFLCKSVVERNQESARNAPLSHQADYKLSVLYAPVITDNLQSTVAAKLGDRFELECHAQSNPPASINWYKQSLSSSETSSSAPLVSFLKFSKSQDDIQGHIGEIASKHVFTGPKYLVHVSTKEDFAFFTCKAQVPGFPEARKVILVGESGPPTIEAPVNEDKIIKIFTQNGMSVKMTCIIYSIPHPLQSDIQWNRVDGVELFADDRYHQYQEDHFFGVNSVLYLGKVESADFGIFNCTVRNPYGEAWQLYQLCHKDDTPLVLAIGSVIAVLFVLLFVCILLYILRHSCPPVKEKTSCTLPLEQSQGNYTFDTISRGRTPNHQLPMTTRISTLPNGSHPCGLANVSYTAHIPRGTGPSNSFEEGLSHGSFKDDMQNPLLRQMSSTNNSNSGYSFYEKDEYHTPVHGPFACYTANIPCFRSTLPTNAHNRNCSQTNDQTGENPHYFTTTGCSSPYIGSSQNNPPFLQGNHVTFSPFPNEIIVESSDELSPKLLLRSNHHSTCPLAGSNKMSLSACEKHLHDDVRDKICSSTDSGVPNSLDDANEQKVTFIHAVLTTESVSHLLEDQGHQMHQLAAFVSPSLCPISLAVDASTSIADQPQNSNGFPPDLLVNSTSISRYPSESQQFGSPMATINIPHYNSSSIAEDDKSVYCKVDKNMFNDTITPMEPKASKGSSSKNIAFQDSTSEFTSQPIIRSTLKKKTSFTTGTLNNNQSVTAPSHERDQREPLDSEDVSPVFHKNRSGTLQWSRV